MATSRAQQVGIWIIAIVLTVGTIGSFAAIVLQNDNQASDQARQQADYNQQLEEYQKQQKAAAEANAANSEPLDGYSAKPFDELEAATLKTTVLKQGEGASVQESDTIKASYFGWLADGRIFDSSNKKDAADVPISFPLTGVIEGWTKGLAGQKVGSVVELAIPAAQAYGPNGSGIIPANAPLKFIVIINAVEEKSAS